MYLYLLDKQFELKAGLFPYSRSPIVCKKCKKLRGKGGKRKKGGQ
jgi:hypothetical protein